MAIYIKFNLLNKCSSRVVIHQSLVMRCVQTKDESQLILDLNITEINPARFFRCSSLTVQRLMLNVDTRHHLQALLKIFDKLRNTPKPHNAQICQYTLFFYRPQTPANNYRLSTQFLFTRYKFLLVVVVDINISHYLNANKMVSFSLDLPVVFVVWQFNIWWVLWLISPTTKKHLPCLSIFTVSQPRACATISLTFYVSLEYCVTSKR